MPTKPISIAIADESFLFAKVLKNYLIEQTGIQVVVHTMYVADLNRKLDDLSPDILLVDIVQQPNIAEMLMVVRNKYPDVKIIILSMCRDLNLINKLLNVGIYGYVSKMNEPEELLEAIISASEGSIHRSSIITESLYLKQEKGYDILGNASQVSLNNRERKILQLLWEEKSNREIADEFFLGTKSIEKIRQDMKEKLGIRSTVGLLKYAITRNIISITPAESGVREERARW